jgi:outer membrane receptor protein involved in Fe transport
MVKRRPLRPVVLIVAFLFSAAALAEGAGGIRGTVFDREYNAPLGAAEVLIAETGEKVTTTDEGNFVFGQVKPGTYTLVFSKDGYARQVKADVVVTEGKMTEIDASLAGEFTEMEEVVVQDMQMEAGTESALLDLRMESPALLDSVGSELMSRAGASDAASALTLVSGATIQEGKYAVVRGLPDRYVNSQMNGVRLPTADPDKRAVQLDQFPSPVIESIQVNKTFTPDQQGDASGGAVNIITKSVPNENMLQFSSELIRNTQDAGKGDFLTYKNGGLNFWGEDADNRRIQTENLGTNWTGAAGVSRGDQPQDYKWSLSAGGKHQIDEDIKIGGFGNFFYQRNNSFFDNGIDDKYWVLEPGDKLTPRYSQGAPPPIGDHFLTSLYGVTQSRDEVKWGGLGTVGIETENHSFGMTYLYTHSAENKTTLAEDTRGKKYYFPGYDRNDPNDPGNGNPGRYEAPYLRNETIDYTERTTKTLQFRGQHKLIPDLDNGLEKLFMLQSPELDWTVARSSSTLDEPDKRLFGSVWYATGPVPPFPFIPQFIEHFGPLQPGENINLGNFQRIWKNISETSDQYFINLKLLFEQWSGDKGYLKFGVFNDKVNRNYNQDSFSNFGDSGAVYYGPWENFWSDKFPSENHPITAANIDVDYKGRQNISAWYYMADVPLCSWFNIIGGVRYEKTELSIVNTPDPGATWLPVGAGAPYEMHPGDGDVSFKRNDALPSIGFEYKPIEKVTLRGSYSETVARQTFKELSPIMQQDYLGGDIFVGNPGLKMSSLKNYDLRLDWTPYQGGLVSLSYFYKKVKDPIEYEQQAVQTIYFTRAVNYPEGKLSGFEFEVRQEMKCLWEQLEGLSLGANATFIDSEVTLPYDEAKGLAAAGFPMKTRDMTNAPRYLYNIYGTYDIENTGTQFSLFYTARGDTLVKGAAISPEYYPNVYETEYGTLNFSLFQKLGKNFKLFFKAKNLLDPDIKTVYRYNGDDVTKTSYKKGKEFSIGLSAEF